MGHLNTDLETTQKEPPCKTLLSMVICQRKVTIVSEYVGLTDVSSGFLGGTRTHRAQPTYQLAGPVPLTVCILKCSRHRTVGAI